MRLGIVLATMATVLVFIFPDDWAVVLVAVAMIGFILPRSMGGFGGGGFRL